MFVSLFRPSAYCQACQKFQLQAENHVKTTVTVTVDPQTELTQKIVAVAITVILSIGIAIATAAHPSLGLYGFEAFSYGLFVASPFLLISFALFISYLDDLGRFRRGEYLPTTYEKIQEPLYYRHDVQYDRIRSNPNVYVELPPSRIVPRLTWWVQSPSSVPEIHTPVGSDRSPERGTLSSGVQSRSSVPEIHTPVGSNRLSERNPFPSREPPVHGGVGTRSSDSSRG